MTEVTAAAVDAVLTTKPELEARAHAGLLIDWILGNLDHSVEELIDHCMRIFVIGAHAIFQPSSSDRSRR